MSPCINITFNADLLYKIGNDVLYNALHKQVLWNLLSLYAVCVCVKVDHTKNPKNQCLSRLRPQSGILNN
jgi:hypothetical protein